MQRLSSIWNDWRMVHYQGKPLVPASPPGFKSWCRAHLGVDQINKGVVRCGNGVFITSARLLRARPLRFYRELRTQLEAGADVEVRSDDYRNSWGLPGVWSLCGTPNA